MAKKHITDNMLLAGPIKGMPVPNDIWDTSLPGFGYKKSTKGKASFFISYYADTGKKVRLVVGKYPRLSLSEARDKASALLTVVAKGQDPKAALAVMDGTGTGAVDHTFNAMFEQYVEERKSGGLKSIKSLASAVRRFVSPTLGKMRVQDITADHVSELTMSLKDTLPVQANRVQNHLSTFFKWCSISPRKLIVTNPVVGLAKPTPKEESRDRVLNDEEMSRVLSACKELEAPYNSMFEILIRTCLRRSEVARLEWSRVDLEKRVLHFGKEHVKNGKLMVLPMPPRVYEILSGMTRQGRYVFSVSNGATAAQQFSRFTKQLRELSGVHNMVIHDFRRTGASKMAEMDVKPHVIEAVLNHVSGEVSGIAAIYNRYTYMDEKRDALVRLERALESKDAKQHQEMIDGLLYAFLLREEKKYFIEYIQLGGEVTDEVRGIIMSFVRGDAAYQGREAGTWTEIEGALDSKVVSIGSRKVKI